MKKLFLLAALFAAAVVNAETISFASGNANTKSIEAKIKSEFSISGDGATWGVYNDSLLCIDAAAGADFTVSVGDNLEFDFNTSNGKSAIIIFKKDYIEIGGKNMVLRYYGEIGDEIKMTVSSKSKDKAAEFAIQPVSSQDETPTATTNDVLSVTTYTSKAAEAKVLTFVAATEEVEIKETNNGYRFFSIEIPSATALENVESTGVAVKTIENGQIVILKNGVKYNVLGAKL